MSARAQPEQVKPNGAEEYRSRIAKAKGYSDIWEIVKDSVKDTLGARL